VVDASADAAYLSLDTGKRLAHMVGSKESILHRTMAMFDLGSFISTGPLEHLIGETLSLAELQRSHRVLKIAATNWVSGQLRVFVHDPARKERGWKERSEEGLTEETWPGAVMASTAIPGVFPPVKIDGIPYVDGGVVMNTPLRPAIDAGATEIHLISLNPDASAIPVVGEPPNTLDIFERLMSLAISATVDDDVESVRFINRVIEGAPQKKNGKHYRVITVHRYNPEIDLGGMVGMLDFRRDRVRKRIEIGELAGVDHDCEREGCVIAGKPFANTDYSRRKAAER
jgi:NTE family protein